MREGRLGYNSYNKRYGLLSSDLWIDPGFHSQTEYSEHRTAIEKWKKETGKEPVAHGIRAKLAEKKQEIQNEQKNKPHTRSQNKDRGAR